MTADQIDFTNSMDTVWGILNQLTELADDLECAKSVTPAHVEMSATVADALRNAYKMIREQGNFACVVPEAA